MLPIGKSDTAPCFPKRLVPARLAPLDVALGDVEGIAWQRRPVGSLYRGAGLRQRIQGIGTNPSTSHKPGNEDRPQECVR